MKSIKLILAMAMCVFLLASVSAFEFDNVKNKIGNEKLPLTIGDRVLDYNKIWDKYAPIEIKNSFGLGQTLFKGALTNHTEVCGKDCSSTLEIEHSGGMLIQDIRFIGGNVLSYKITANGKTIRPGQEVEAGIYEVEIDGIKNPTDSIDWQIKTQGQWLVEWANWTYGDLVLDSNQEICGDYYYKNIVINNSAILTICDYDGTAGKGEVNFYVANDFNMSSGTTINGYYDGWRGGAGKSGASVGNGASGEGTGAGEGGGYYSGSEDYGGGGGGAGAYSSGGGGGDAYTAGSLSDGGPSYMIANSLDTYKGSGGGGAGKGTSTGYPAGNGGDGGATILIQAPNINIAGIINNRGANGQTPDCSIYACGGGGGGSGGLITFYGNILNLDSATLNVQGGSGGNGDGGTDDCGQGGGGGSGGLIRKIYETSLSQAGISQTYTGGGGGSGVGSSCGLGGLLNGASGGTGAVYDNQTTFTGISAGVFSYNLPINNTVTNACVGYDVSALVYGPTNITNISMFSNEYGFNWVDWNLSVDSQTASLSGSNCIGEGEWVYFAQACDTDGVCYDTENRTVIVDTTAPTINLIEPSTDVLASSFPRNVTFNMTASDDRLDDCWYWTDEDSTNHTFTCGISQNVSFSDAGSSTIYYCANDTATNENCSSITRDIITYDQSSSTSFVGVGKSVTFNLNISIADADSTTANFTINNTVYENPSKYDYANYVLFTKTIIIPQGWGNETGNYIDWNWDFNIPGVSSGTTDTQQLQVFEVAIDNCSTYTTLVLNYTLYDEQTKSNTLPTPLENQSIETDVLIESYDNSSLSWEYSTSTTDSNFLQICVPSGALNYTNYNFDVVTRFSANDHVVEFSYLDDFNLSNSSIPQNINLYDLYTGTERTEYSTSFLINYQDEAYLPVEGAIVDLLRYYVNSGEYLSVENAQTDADGNTRLHLVTEDVRYKVLVRYQGELVYTSPPFLALCQATPCQINFQKQTDITPTNIQDIENLDYYVTLDKDSRQVEMTYSTQDGTSAVVQMEVTKWDAYSNDTVCSDTATSSGGTLLCTVPLASTNTSYIVTITKDGTEAPLYNFDLKPSAQDTFGMTGIILTGLLFLTLVLMAISSGPIAVTSFGILGIVFAGLLNLFSGGSIFGVGSSLMWLIIAGVILIVKASNRRSGG